MVCYAIKANSNLAILAFSRRPARASTSSPAASSSACWPPAAARPGHLLGRRQDRATRCVGRSTRASAASTSSRFRSPPAAAVARRRSAAGHRCRCGSTPTSTPRTHPYISTGLKESKFGIAYADAIDVYRRWRRRLDASRSSAIDCHIGSQLLDAEPLLDALDKLIELVDTLDARRHRRSRTSTSAAASAFDYGDEDAGPSIDVGDYLRAGVRARRRLARRRVTADSRSGCCSSRAARWSATPARC